jgi:hypothetical protein
MAIRQGLPEVRGVWLQFNRFPSAGAAT